ncbi:MAG: tetratricopeptide repeat protein [Cyclobacteriaceae bacterium]
MNSERIKTLEQWIEEDPSDPFNKYGLAMELILNKPERAALLFDELLTQHSDYLPTYYIAAQFFSQSNSDKAIAILEAGIELAKKQKNEKTLRELRSALDELRF